MQKKPAKPEQEPDELEQLSGLDKRLDKYLAAGHHDEPQYGDMVDARLDDGQWITGEIIKVSKGKFLIQYSGTNLVGTIQHKQVEVPKDHVIKHQGEEDVLGKMGDRGRLQDVPVPQQPRFEKAAEQFNNKLKSGRYDKLKIGDRVGVHTGWQGPVYGKIIGQKQGDIHKKYQVLYDSGESGWFDADFLKKAETHAAV